MGTLFRDVLYAMRQMARNPGFSAAIVLTLGIGIGASTTVFSFVNSVFIRPLAYSRPDELVQVWSIHKRSGADGGMSAEDFRDCLQQNRSFAQLAAYRFQHLNLGTGPDAQRVVAILTTADFLNILGVQPVVGRGFAPDEQSGRGMPVAIVTWAAWQRHWGGHSNVLGSSVLLDGQPHTVVGVLPAGFQIRFPFCGQAHAALPEPEIYLPLALDGVPSDRAARSCLTLARLKPEVTLEQARNDLGVIASRLAQEYPAFNKDWDSLVLPLHELKSNADVAAPLLLAPVVLVLLIACVNVANMLLARAASRQKEIAIRLAVGVGRWALVRQLVMESLALAIIGGTLGALIAFQAGQVIQKAFQNSLLFVLPSLRMDGTVLAFNAIISMLAGVGVGVVPALQGARTPFSELLQAGTSSSAETRKSRRFSRGLVVTEIAMALVLLSATGLLLKSLIWTWKVDLGFRSENVLCLNVTLPAAAYAEADRQHLFFGQLRERICSHPGVESAALASSLPLGSRGSIMLRLPGKVTSTGGPDELRTGFTAVSPGYFKTIGVPLVAGRDFTSADSSSAAATVIINSTMARKYWPDANPVGALIESAGRQRLIVGVVGDLRRPHLAGVSEPLPEIFGPLQQWPATQATLLLKTPLARETSTASGVRREIHTLEPCAALSDVQTLAEAVSRSTSIGRLVMVLMACFAGSALLLAAIGVYGLMSYSVSRRTQEIGIRMALGALPRQVMRLILLEGSRLLCWALILGVPLSLAMGKILAAKLHRVSAFDTLVSLCVVTLLAIAMLAACYFPARRAVRGDPLSALRYE